jgi:hypothetical protein
MNALTTTLGAQQATPAQLFQNSNLRALGVAMHQQLSVRAVAKS